MNTDFSHLAPLGWSQHFASQVSLDDMNALMPVRVVAVHRNGADVIGTDFSGRVPPLRVQDSEDQLAVGDVDHGLTGLGKAVARLRMW